MSKNSAQPKVIDPVVEVGANVWHDPHQSSYIGKITKIKGNMVFVNYGDYISTYPISDITVEFVSPFLVLVAGKNEMVIHSFLSAA